MMKANICMEFCFSLIADVRNNPSHLKDKRVSKAITTVFNTIDKNNVDSATMVTISNYLMFMRIHSFFITKTMGLYMEYFYSYYLTMQPRPRFFQPAPPYNFPRPRNELLFYARAHHKAFLFLQTFVMGKFSSNLDTF